MVAAAERQCRLSHSRLRAVCAGDAGVKRRLPHAASDPPNVLIENVLRRGAVQKKDEDSSEAKAALRSVRL